MPDTKLMALPVLSTPGAETYFWVVNAGVDYRVGLTGLQTWLGALSLSSLSDALITSPVASHVLRYNSTSAKFVNVPLAVGVSELAFTGTRDATTAAWGNGTWRAPAAADITGLSEAVDDRVGSLLVAGANVTLTYDDTANTLTVASTGGGGGGTSMSDGLVATPGFPFASDTNTGFYRPGADTIGFSAGGLEQVRIVGVASAVNRVELRGSATGAAVRISPEGTDANISLSLEGKGTGFPTVVAPAVDNNSTRVANTAWFIGQRGTANPNADGTAAPGTSARWAAIDHVHPTDTTRMPVAGGAFTARVRVAVAALTDAASIATDAALANIYTVTLGGNRTLANPTNAAAGDQKQWRIQQDATGSRTLAYGANFKFPGGIAPVLSTAANSVDYLTCVCTNGTLWECNLTKDYR